MLVQRSATAAYLQRTFFWWRYTFPHYVDPAGLPPPPGYPPPSAREPPWTVPAARLLRKVPVWEHELSNVLLFGHAMPTTAEVRYRAAYLEWCVAAVVHGRDMRNPAAQAPVVVAGAPCVCGARHRDSKSHARSRAQAPAET